MDFERAAFLNALIRPSIIFFVTLGALLVARSLVRRWLRTRAIYSSHLTTLLDSSNIASALWALAAALYVAITAEATPKNIEQFVGKTILILLVVSFCLVIAGIIVRFVTVYGRQQNAQYANIGLSRTLIYVLVLGAGSTVLLKVLGLDITPLLATLGVGGIALALALQDTLANFFAGVHIIVESPIYVGDFIKLNTSEEGIVTDIGWRTTRVRTLQNNTIVIPNSKITTTILTNYTMPEKRLSTDVDIVVAHEADLDQVRRIVYQEIDEMESVLKDPPPIVLMDPGVTPTHVQLKAWVQIPDRVQQGLVRSELRFRLAQRFQREGVPLPRLDYVVTTPTV